MTAQSIGAKQVNTNIIFPSIPEKKKELDSRKPIFVAVHPRHVFWNPITFDLKRRGEERRGRSALGLRTHHMKL